MGTAARILIGLVALEHVWFAVLEMVLWTKPLGRKTFRTTETFANESAALAMNQGLYNLFLVAGLVWSFIADAQASRGISIFFLGCVVVAGIVGGLTVSKRITFLQSIPAAAALALVLLSG